MYRKGLWPSYLFGLDENPDYTCPDLAELPVYAFTGFQVEPNSVHYRESDMELYNILQIPKWPSDQACVLSQSQYSLLAMGMTYQKVRDV